MADSNFQPADKIFWHDKILAKTLLKFFPKKVVPNHITFLIFSYAIGGFFNVL